MANDEPPIHMGGQFSLIFIDIVRLPPTTVVETSESENNTHLQSAQRVPLIIIVIIKCYSRHSDFRPADKYYYFNAACCRHCYGGSYGTERSIRGKCKWIRCMAADERWDLTICGKHSAVEFDVENCASLAIVAGMYHLHATNAWIWIDLRVEMWRASTEASSINYNW